MAAHAHGFGMSAALLRHASQARIGLSANASNASTLVASTSAPAASDWFLQYTAIYIIPLWIVLGVVNNVCVMWVMPRARVLVPRRVKRLYVGIALGDLFTVLAQDLVYFYLEQGLYFTTNGAYWVRLPAREQNALAN